MACELLEKTVWSILVQAGIGQYIGEQHEDIFEIFYGFRRAILVDRHAGFGRHQW